MYSGVLVFFHFVDELLMMSILESRHLGKVSERYPVVAIVWQSCSSMAIKLA